MRGGQEMEVLRRAQLRGICESVIHKSDPKNFIEQS